VKKIIKYQLNQNGTIPSYIFNGGYFADNLDIMQANIIGVSVDDESQLPQGYIEMNKAGLTSVLASIEMNKRSEDALTFTPMTSEEKAAYLDQWLTEVGFPNLQ
jgi:hypothetical protein